MSIEVLYLLRKDDPGAALRDLDDVTLLADVTSDDGVTIPVGTAGTIVGVWRDGEAFEVEFALPEGAVATVHAGALTRTRRSAS
ncbi:MULTISPECIES: DUF4926 domain-containing protein [Methylobacterium]|uniref:DUF4926 domain-containing protein n=1 Tax=Methylobacterium bullatum TaxID=570505 RepID=A0A679K3J4_9HYPH|nr:DUF4926 domain-containing protein [Methylobacterium sp. WL19]TXN23490.1 DUF4926 domain-containing protein [Methylobacterium sp. WL19]CAA2138665.1 hypothetical protein MBLL_01257 [Methylobacterium bullatum]